MTGTVMVEPYQPTTASPEPAEPWVIPAETWALVVDLNEEPRQETVRILTDLGLSVTEADNPDSALAAVRDRQYTIAVVEPRMNTIGADGFAVIRRIKAADDRVIVIAYTDPMCNRTSAENLIREGAYAVVPKVVRTALPNEVRSILGCSVPDGE